jgi:CRISPR/Cas system type I-B associated protein Csh2 (Cas7 group RAMP superfamily)
LKKEIASLAFKKFCDYQKYLLYRAINDATSSGTEMSESDKHKLVEAMINAEAIWA